MRVYRWFLAAATALVVAAAAVGIHHWGAPRRLGLVRLGAVQSVRIELDRRTFDGTTTAPPVIRALGRGGAQELADSLDTLGTPPSGTFACPRDSGLRDTFTFTRQGQPIVAVSDVDGCPTVTVHLPHRRDPVLWGSLDPLALELLGLPVDYGRP